MSSRVGPFSAKRGSNQAAGPSSSSNSKTLSGQERSVRIVNYGANICFVRIGKGAQTASTADTPVPAGTSIILAKGPEEDTIAYISSAGTSIYIQLGEGGS
jgi:hypothetical protein